MDAPRGAGGRLGPAATVRTSKCKCCVRLASVGSDGVQDTWFEVPCVVTRWVDDEPQPGLVEAQLTDATGTVLTFIDKSVMFADCLPWSSYPFPGAIRCHLAGDDPVEPHTVWVSLEVESVDGRSVVKAERSSVSLWM